MDGTARTAAATDPAVADDAEEPPGQRWQAWVREGGAAPTRAC
jgi:hypothetical protein